MNAELDKEEFTLKPEDNARLANLCGQLDEHVRLIERRLGVEVSNRSNHFRITGPRAAVRAGRDVIESLYAATAHQNVTPSSVHLALQEAGLDTRQGSEESGAGVVRTRRGLIRARGPHQDTYLRDILEYDLTFGIGPAGTGKTYLAAARAVEALETERVRRLVLVRPAVEAGERLGFLPGDLAQKIDPYLRPMYDALYEMLGFDRVAKLIERNVIEVAPLAYMRGRTLNESFILLDEAQNTTVEQMKMFLTRIGFGSRAVVNGDVTQIDLPRGQISGLRHVIDVLQGVNGVSFVFFSGRDVVRHPLVQRIVNAYEQHESSDT